MKDKFIRKEMAFTPIKINLVTTHSDGSATFKIVRGDSEQVIRLYAMDTVVLERQINLTLEEK